MMPMIVKPPSRQPKNNKKGQIYTITAVERHLLFMEAIMNNLPSDIFGGHWLTFSLAQELLSAQKASVHQAIKNNSIDLVLNDVGSLPIEQQGNKGLSVFCPC